MGGRLTHDHDNLAGLLVALALAADLVKEAIALMLEGLTPLTCRNACHQLILNREDQKVADTKRNRQNSHQCISSIPIAWLQSPPITPCRGCAPCHLPGAPWGRSGEGRGVWHRKPLLRIHHRWEPLVEEELEGVPLRPV